MRIRSQYFTIAVALFFVGTHYAATADELPIPADEFVYCTTCHGVQLMGNEKIKAPRLSGMDTWYVEHQLQSFKKGWRGTHENDISGMEMQPMAAALNDEQISAAAGFTHLTQSPRPLETVSGNANKGRMHYATCGACHGVSGEGNQALGGPALTGLNDWYLLTQLMNFRDGSRGSHPDDTYGMQMRAAIQVLSDDAAMLDVVSYISSLEDN